MMKAIGCSTEKQLGTMGFESLTRGFANFVYAATRRGYPLVVKALMDLSSKRLDRGTVGQADMYAGRFGIGPKVHYACKASLVMDRLSGRTLEYFLRVYAASVDDPVGPLVTEVRMFEPLAWLEPAVFFLAMPQFKPEGTSRWNELAMHRWAKFQETKSLLV